MKKTIYTVPQIKTAKMCMGNSYMLEDWTAPDGNGGGGNEPESNESWFDDEENVIVKTVKSLWDE